MGPQLSSTFKGKQWQNTLDQVSSLFNFMEGNSNDVRKLVEHISLFKVSAVDKLSTRVLKDAFLSLIDQLTFTFNLSLKKGVFPDKWKAATIIPLQKDRNKEDVSNHRPVSLLPLPGKLLEKLVHKQLNTYLENHQLLGDCQGGFRQGHSTISKITELTDDLYRAMDSRETTVSVFIDFRKAFDTVRHNILLNKLERLGVKGLNKSWFESYLTNRTEDVSQWGDFKP